MPESSNRYIDLQENVGGGRGAHTSVSVLNPFIRIERFNEDETRKDGRKQPKDDQYRIIATFTLQVKIHAFEKGYRRRHEKIFDSISVKYLYREGERHDIRPIGDKNALLEVADEAKKTTGYKFGVTANPNSVVAPTAEVSVQRDKTLTYGQHTTSWKRGVNFEPYVKHEHREGSAWPGMDQVKKHYHHFQVHSRHSYKQRPCKFLEPANPRDESCFYRDTRKPIETMTTSPVVKVPKYNKCAHWFWQTEAAAHLWLPEIYEAFLETIIITRVLRLSELDTFVGNNVQKKQYEAVQHHFHFDFVVTTRLRELGWTSRDYISLRRPTRPPEVRVKNDFGYPLAPDRVAFCLWGCATEVYSYPCLPTRSLQQEAEKEVAEKGPVVKQLVTNTVYWERKREREKKNRDKGKKVHEHGDQILEEIQRKLADLELREKLDNLEHEIHHQPCKWHHQHKQTSGCHCHPESHHSPTRDCRCGSENTRSGHAGKHPPGDVKPEPNGTSNGWSNNHCDCDWDCKCKSGISHPKPTRDERPEHNCACNGHCKCKSEYRSHDHDSDETRGRPTYPRPTDDDYRHCTPNGHRFSFHHRRYHNHSHQGRHSTSPRDHSLAPSLDIFSANDTRHASPHTADMRDDERDQHYREHQSTPTAGCSRRSLSKILHGHSQERASEEDIPKRPSSLRRPDCEEDSRADIYNKAQLDALSEEREDARILLKEARKRAREQEIDELLMQRRADEETMHYDRDRSEGHQYGSDSESAISLTSGEDGAPGFETEDEISTSPAPEPEIHQAHSHHVRLQSPMREVYDFGWRRVHDGRHPQRPAIIRVRSPRRHRSLSPRFAYERPRATSLGELGQRLHVHESEGRRCHGRGRIRGSSLGDRFVEYVTEGHLPSGSRRERRYGKY